MIEKALLESVLRRYGLTAEETPERYGCGHINDTFLTRQQGKAYILQRVSPAAFHAPEKVMENIAGVTARLRESILKRGGDPERETLTLLPADDGRLFIKDADGATWRLTLFIDGAAVYQRAESEAVFREAGRAFGEFLHDLADYPAETLHETIPHFHDTPSRVEALREAVRTDAAGRLAQVGAEVDFALSRASRAGELTDALARGELPLRVTHNDTKLNNVLLDAETGRALCVIDLDTVMPGLCAYDFGDAIRFGANTADEDEKELDKVRFSLPMYRAYLSGYVSAAGGMLTAAELASLPVGAWMMTYECGTRFLTDFLNGDIYFHTAYPTHNLTRARNQFALLADMERHAEEMRACMETLSEG